MSVSKLKKSLKEFSQTDSEFAKFLNDQSDEDLMLSGDEQNDDDDNDDDDDDDDVDNDDDDEKSVSEDFDFDNDSLESSKDESDMDTDSSKLKLAVASDDEDDISSDNDDKHGPLKTLTVKMITNWRRKLQTNCIESLKSLIEGFAAAVKFTTDSTDECQYVVKGGTVYNAIIGACLVELVPALDNILSDSKLKSDQSDKAASKSSQSDKAASKSDQSEKAASKSSQSDDGRFVSSKNWKILKPSVRVYIKDMFLLMGAVGKDELLLDLVKHFYDLCKYIVVFPKFHKTCVKKCIDLWSSGSEEAIRILALRCILKIRARLSERMVEFTLSKMYIAFVRNSKFTSVTTLPQISYMKRSLVELLTYTPTMAYKSAFLNIRQMAKLLHNALKLQKKEVKQTVCNWQFVHPLSFYCSLIGRLHSDEYIKTLVHPIVEVVLGTLRLNPSASFHPLRISLLRSLIQMEKEARIYIPVAPFILEILDFPALLKNPKQSNMKSLNLDCILRASKMELKEKVFCDSLIEAVFELSLTFLANHANSVAFPELILPFLIQLKKFLKICRVSAYTRKVKLILGKIEENSKFTEKFRRGAVVNLADQNSVNVQEDRMLAAEPPILKFYNNWIKVAIKQKETLANPKQKDDDGLPKLVRPQRPKATDEDRQDYKGLFMQESDDDDDDDDDDDEERFELKEDRNSRKNKETNNSKETNKKESKGKKLTNGDTNNKESKGKKLTNGDTNNKESECGANLNENRGNRVVEEIDLDDDIPDMVQDFEMSDLE